MIAGAISIWVSLTPEPSSDNLSGMLLQGSSGLLTGSGRIFPLHVLPLRLVKAAGSESGQGRGGAVQWLCVCPLLC